MRAITFCLSLAITATALPGVHAKSFTITSNKGSKLEAQEITRFNRPWAMTFLPDGSMLVTTKPGAMFLVTQAGQRWSVAGVPKVEYAGQGGLGDVVLHPNFRSNRTIYLSFAEASRNGNAGAVVIRAKFQLSGDKPYLSSIQRIWVQGPKTSGRGHYSHRMAFSPDGKLFITAGDRQELTPAQDFAQALGKIIRVNDDGSIPPDNPWQNQGARAKSFWTMGHRNLLGIAFDGSGRLWAH